MVRDFKVFVKFVKLVSWSRVIIPKANSFNEIVTLDINEFVLKHVLWIVDSFC